MELGTSLFLIAVGAILTFAVNADISGIEISTVGIILMIIGVLGLLISLLYLAPRRRAVVEERPVDTTRVLLAVTDPGWRDGVAVVRAHLLAPTGAVARVVVARVESQAGDHEVGVPAIGVARDPLTRAGLAP